MDHRAPQFRGLHGLSKPRLLFSQLTQRSSLCVSGSSMLRLSTAFPGTFTALWLIAFTPKFALAKRVHEQWSRLTFGFNH